MSTLPFLETSPVVAHLASFGDRVALLGAGAPGGGLSYAALAARVADVATRLGAARRLVLVEGGNDVDTLVVYLGALAAGCPVLLTGSGAAREALASAYDPDVSWTADGDLVEHRAFAATGLHPDLALLLSTSGTTGSPKLVRLSRTNLVANARAIADYLALTDDDVAVTTLPLHYCYGLSVVHSHLLQGASLVLTDLSVTDEAFWDLVRDHGVTSFAGVPHTFDLLDRTGFAARDLPRLRYLTQAGGRMAPEVVRRYARLGAERGWELFVMYGATEATARMAWLPPLLAADAPDTIGIPVPGGSFTVEPLPGSEPDHGAEVGELVYRGHNVMLGYAECPADLDLGRTVHELRTGDLGRQREDGLYEIVGRRSRFAKVFGLRVDLDRVERVLAGRGVVAAAADGGDVLVLAVCSGAAPVDPARITSAVREEFGLAPAGVRVLTPPALPRLPTGKTDYRAIVAAAYDPEADRGLHAAVGVDEVVALFAALLNRPDAIAADSFVTLGGDSLSYVEASLRLERLLGDLPPGWHAMPLAELARERRAPRPGKRVETNVVLRAFAITTVVAGHAGLFSLLGGAHLLYALVGYNFGRFLVTDAPPRTRVAAISRSLVRIAVPSALVIGLVAWVDERISWRQALFVNQVYGEYVGHMDRPWQYWFIEALVLTLLGLALLLAVPAVHRLERRQPFWFPVGLALLGLVTLYELIWSVPGDESQHAPIVFWLWALGWATAKAEHAGHRLVVSVLTVLTVPALFTLMPERNHYIMAGILVLVWLPQLRVPSFLARVTGLLAGASLWIYLVHWQVYPELKAESPLAATVASLLVGVLAWQAWERVTGNGIAASVVDACGRPWTEVRRWWSSHDAYRDDQPAHLAAGPARHR